MDTLLEIENLHVKYKDVEVLKGIDLKIERGQIIGLVGESGSGKSTLIRSIIGLLDSGGHISDGQILFCGQNLAEKSHEEFRSLRGERMGMVFQNPGGSLNPTRKIGKQFFESVASHRKTGRKESYKKALNMLESLNLKDGERILESYPFEMSGGMNQRVAIALAMIMEPEIVLADEPTSALDVTSQMQVIEEMKRLRDKYSTAILLATHNMGVIARMADMVGVMYGGKIVEFGTNESILKNPYHPYTLKLISSIPSVKGASFLADELQDTSKTDFIGGGCVYYSECSISTVECDANDPNLANVDKNHWCRCLNAGKGKSNESDTGA